MNNRLTILICTHNRAELLEKTLASLNRARRPQCGAEILVMANACSDGTHALLERYVARRGDDELPLRWIDEPAPGKSHALNRAIPEIRTPLVAFVDDDHRVDENYLVAIEAAARDYPEAGMYCGRILPDWDGNEPAWVQDEGPYKIYPLPVPRYDQGEAAKPITAEAGPVPGGGNLVLRREVFEVAGNFSTDMGPRGHDLGGGEDSEFVLRTLSRRVKLQYVPAIVQYHYVDMERLKLGYLVRKAYQRTRATARLAPGSGGMHAYMGRKLATYLWHSLFTLDWTKRRFYLVRSAATLGEIVGSRGAGLQRRKRLPLPPDRGMVVVESVGLLCAIGGLLALTTGLGLIREGLLPVLGVASAATGGLVYRAVRDFTRTGPRVREEILSRYRRYSFYAITRLALWAFGLMLLMGGAGAMLYAAVTVIFDWTFSPWLAALAAGLGIAAITALQCCRLLLHNPGLLIASLPWRPSRLYSLWQKLNPARLRIVYAVAGGLVLLVFVLASWELAGRNKAAELIALWSAGLFYGGLLAWAGWMPEAHPPRSRKPSSQPNLLLIGSDTLRADALGRGITPHVDRLAQAGAHFTQCYVPCARTAPSLVSLLTGTWPHTHGIRDNFVSDQDTRLPVSALPHWLSSLGYRSAALSDWCGADMGKFDFGFDHLDLPEDQWNLKFFIRQGPKILRLFLSLFTHNRLGRLLLPEIYYQGGVPLTTQLGRRARRLVSRLAESHQPFLLNVFYSTTHPPFASEYPWYTRFADPAYRGKSKFAMARLTDPFDIIRRQGEPREEFDLEQILALYDGSIAQFDDQVGRMLAHLEKGGLLNNTIVVIYSDHGMEFFEHGTWGQGNSAVGEASPRIPLVIHDPRKPAVGKVEQVVRSIDIAPTLAELAGGAPPPGVDGVSLAALLENPQVPLNLTAYNETGLWVAHVPGLPEAHLRYPDLLELMDVPNPATGTLGIRPEYQRVVLAAKDRMVRQGKWKLVYQPLEKGSLLRLYDLEQDPECGQDVLSTHPGIAKSLWEQLSHWLTADGLGKAAIETTPTATAASS